MTDFDLDLDADHDTEWGHSLCISGKTDSYQGRTLVSVVVDERILTLEPTEARRIARAMIKAANMAEGV